MSLVRADALRKLFGSDGVIKLQARDFEELPKGGEWLHVNMMPCTHEAGKTYTVACIKGRDQDGAPLLCTDTKWRVSIVETKVVKGLSQIDRSDLGRCIGMPGTHDELGAILVGRYFGTRGLTPEKVSETDFMVSWLVSHQCG